MSSRYRELREKARKGGTRYLPKLREQHKLTARERLDLLLEKGFDVERQSYETTLVSEDRNEGLRAFVEKRKPVFRGR